MNALRFAVPSLLLSVVVASACSSSSRVRAVDEPDASPDSGLADASAGPGGRGAGGKGAGGGTGGAGGTSAADGSVGGNSDGRDASSPTDAGTAADVSSPPIDTDSGFPPLGEFCNFADPSLEDYVRNALQNLPIDGGAPDGPIPVALASRIASLDLFCDCSAAPDLAGIQCLQGLRTVNLSDGVYPSFAELAALPNLTEFSLQYQSELPADIALLKHVTKLDLGHINSITDLTPLEGMTSLTELDLPSNGITDLTGIESLKNLETLSLNGNFALTDLTPIAGLTKLASLNIGNTGVTDLAPLQGLTALETLSANSDKFTNLGPLEYLTSLSNLNIDGTTNFTDFSPLVRNTGIGDGDTLNLRARVEDCALIKTDIATLTARVATITGVPTCP